MYILFKLTFNLFARKEKKENKNQTIEKLF